MKHREFQLVLHTWVYVGGRKRSVSVTASRVGGARGRVPANTPYVMYDRNAKLREATLSIAKRRVEKLYSTSAETGGNVF